MNVTKWKNQEEAALALELLLSSLAMDLENNQLTYKVGK